MSITLYHGKIQRKKIKQFGKKRLIDRGALECGYHFGSEEAAHKRVKDVITKAADLQFETWKRPSLRLPKEEAKKKLLYEVNNRSVSPRVYEVELDIDSPLRMHELDRLSQWKPYMILWRLFDDEKEYFTPQEISGVTDKEIEKYFKYTYDNSSFSIPGVGKLSGDESKQCKWIAKFLAKKGFDSIVYDNVVEGGGDSFIVLDSNRIAITDVYALNKLEIANDIYHDIYGEGL